MVSSIILGSTSHTRVTPVRHHFKYPLYMLEVDVDNLNQLNQMGLFFGYNRKTLFSIFDSDYLDTSEGTISEKITKVLKQVKDYPSIDRVKLVTIPRLLIKTFRPVNFYLCYSKDKALVSMVAEVTNSYHESSYYLLDNVADSNKGYRFSINKDFHVSPFFEEKGEYTFDVLDRPQDITISITYRVNHQISFHANFEGRKKVLNRRNALLTLFTYPLTALSVFPRILWQAGKLYLLRQLPARSKPELSTKTTLRSMPLSRFQKYIIKRIEKVCRTGVKGQLVMVLPDQTRRTFGCSEDGPQAHMSILNTWFFRSIQFGGEIGLGESYMRGEWDSEHVETVLEFMVLNEKQLQKTFHGTLIVNMMNRLKHRLRKNTLTKSKKNIAAHYDLGNELYRCFLDETMMYSSGLYEADTDTLNKAQIQKVKQLVHHLQLVKTDHVLEIGSGWAYAAMYMAETHGCRVTTITLSEEQKSYIEDKIKEKGLEHLITVKIQDYRQMTGEFDAILSIEMLEAVGHAFLRVFYETCHHLLKEKGRLVLQTITYPDDKYDTYCQETDFIQKHIFPGGHLPSLGILEAIRTTRTRFKKQEAINIAQSYAKTLAAWRKAFEASKETLLTLGFDTTRYRKWIYYFASCEAAFKTDYLGCYQIVYEKGGT